MATTAISAQEKTNQTDSQDRKHGLWKKYYPNEQLRYQGRFEHGVKVDTFKFYFDDGSLKAVNYFRGNGEAYSWQYGGESQLAAEGLYKGTKRDSIWTFYDMDGNLVSREHYKDDKKQGKSITYFENGKKAEVIHYDKGVKSGAWQQFYETGKPKAKGQYVNGKLHGEVTYFEPNGKPGARGKYRNGLMHGTWYFFDDNLQVEKKQEWKYGKNLTPDEEEEEEEPEGTREADSDKTGK
ncbi:MAG: hypothetical protein U5L96_08640 [Owenweeksia sp.]|nr:hypothetical protein [Owenweeksia sp.]